MGVMTTTEKAGYDSHVIDDAKHRTINDAGTSATDLFSASKIISDLSGKSDTTHNHDGVYEPADATILKDADIGTTVQAYNATNALTSDITYETLNTNGDVGTTAGTLAAGDHNHTGVYEPADATILKDADIGVTVQAYDVNTAKLNVLQTFTISQRSAITTNNDLSFDLAVTNKFKCTPTALGTLTFTNLAAQSGTVILDNTGGFAISLAASIKAKSGVATTLSTAGIYLIGYDCDGTNVYITVSAAMV